MEIKISFFLDRETDQFFRRKLEAIEHMLVAIQYKEKEIMAQEQDLQSAIAAIGTALTRLQSDVTAIVEKLKTSGAIPDADIQSLVAVSAGIGSAADSIEAALNPPPPAA
jgi:predicted  nucleic acid-binding Zn-ribbon protein